MASLMLRKSTLYAWFKAIMSLRTTVLATLCCILSTELTVLLPVRAAATFNPAQQAPVTPDKPSPEQLAGGIASRHLFGMPTPSLASAVPSARGLGGYALTGILFSDTETDSRILVSGSGGTSILAVGDSLPDGTRLLAVHAEEAVFARGDHAFSVPNPQHLAALDKRIPVLSVDWAWDSNAPVTAEPPQTGSTFSRMHSLRAILLKNAGDAASSQAPADSATDPSADHS